ncbi:MAG: bifunctional nuclease domain-containing protein [Acidobacteriota bacterium]
MQTSDSGRKLESSPERDARDREELAAPTDELVAAELNTVGWDALSGSPVVLLRELASGQVLPIWIGMAEARAIGFELHGIETPRPMTHDLTTSLIAVLGGELEEVIISDLREGTYYGLLKLRVEGESEPRWLDTRPSDGLALALRSNALIRIAKPLLEELPTYQFQAPESPDQVVRALGLTVVLTSAELQQEHSLPDRMGLVVIAASGEAERRGLQRGDLILEIDGRVPREPLDLLEAIEDSTSSHLSITFLREGVESSVELDLGAPSRPRSKNLA